MDSARFLRVHRIDVVEGDVRLVADFQIGRAKAQGVLYLPYDDPVTAKTMAAFMVRSVRMEQNLRVLEAMCRMFREEEKVRA